MTDLTRMTAVEVRALSTDDLVEAIAQMLYDHAQYASDAEDKAVTEAIKDRYNTKMQTYCGAAEHVRNILRD
jgi:hypothetical protein